MEVPSLLTHPCIKPAMRLTIVMILIQGREKLFPEVPRNVFVQLDREDEK